MRLGIIPAGQVVEQDSPLGLGPGFFLRHGIEYPFGLHMVFHGLFRLLFLHIYIAQIGVGLQLHPVGGRRSEQIKEGGHAFLVHPCVGEQYAQRKLGFCAVSPVYAV